MAIEEDVRSAQAGDADATARLLRLAGRLAYARACERVSDHALAEDVTQESLLVVLTSLPRLREPKAFLAWLRTIVDRVSVRLRGRLANDGHLQPEWVEGAEGSEDPVRTLERDEAAQQVRRAMAALPPRDRLVVKLFYYEGLSCRQVAEFLDTTTDAVKTRLKRTRHRLKERMMTIPTKKSERLSITWRFSSDEAFAGPTFPEGYFPDAFTHTAYFNLYPGGRPDRAVGRRAVPAERLEPIIESLHALGLIEPTDGEWRCTIPVVLDEDMEALKPWATRLASPVISRLDELYDDIVKLGHLVRGHSPLNTIKALALRSEIPRRPFTALTRAMNVTAPVRGRQVPAFAAASTSERLHARAFLGGAHIHQWQEKDGHVRAYEAYVVPKGTNRSAVQALARRCDGRDLGDREHVLWRLFGRLFAEPVSVGKERDLLGSLGIDLGIDVERAEGIWQGLINLHAVERRGHLYHLAVPHLPLAPWQEFLEKIDTIAEDVPNLVAEGAEDLRRRILHCSFADCNFSDTVFASLWCAQALIGEEIRSRGWVEIPSSADFSWGVLIAR